MHKKKWNLKKTDQIVAFASALFTLWLDDYEVEAESIRERNAQHATWHLNQNVERNLRDGCLPIDYFARRMLRLGLCQDMEQIGHVLKLMHSFDDAGFQEFSEPKPEAKHDHVCSAGN